MRTRLAGFIIVGLLITGATGCGDDRSAEAFCDTMKSEKARILTGMQASEDAADANPDELAGMFGRLAGSLQGIGELRTYFAKLADVAPEEIRVDVEIVAESFNDQLDSAGDAVSDPVGGLSSGLLTALTTSGQLSSVDSFARENCGEGI